MTLILISKPVSAVSSAADWACKPVQTVLVEYKPMSMGTIPPLAFLSQRKQLLASSSGSSQGLC